MMSGAVFGFIVWSIVGCLLVGLGIYAFLAKKEVAFGFWSNVDMFPVKDVKAYNRAVGRLWCIFGIVFIALGLPLLTKQNSGFILISILGVMAESIAAMAVYVTVIEKKYRKKQDGMPG